MGIDAETLRLRRDFSKEALIVDWSFAQKPLTTLEEAKRFIEKLVEHGKQFHFEDPVDDLGHIPKEMVPIVKARVSEMYEFEWGDFECPIGYLVEVDNA